MRTQGGRLCEPRSGSAGQVCREVSFGEATLSLSFFFCSRKSERAGFSSGPLPENKSTISVAQFFKVVFRRRCSFTPYITHDNLQICVQQRSHHITAFRSKQSPLWGTVSPSGDKQRASCLFYDTCQRRNALATASVRVRT